MKILFVSDLHFFTPWFEWLRHQAPPSDLLIIGGDLLDQHHPASQSHQVEWVSSWIRNFPRLLCVCSGNHDRTWNSMTNCWESPGWLKELHTPTHRTRGGLMRLGDITLLARGIFEPVPLRRADIWISHCPPAGTAVSQSANNRDEGDHSLARHVKRRGPKLLLCGHQHSPVRWRSNLRNTLCVNPGRNAHGSIPNHILVDTDRSTALWHTSNAVSVFIEKIEIPLLHAGRSHSRRHFKTSIGGTRRSANFHQTSTASDQ